MKRRADHWTNASAKLLARGRDPVAEIINRARQLVYGGLEAGWSGPPFEPLGLAELLGIGVVPTEDVRDARIVPVGRQGLRIEYNPNRPLHRIRYSIAHELGHTLFPDCSEVVRNRALYHESTADSWQLEALCNIAAAEILMPAASLANVDVSDVTIDDLMEVRTKFGVSAEALMIRLTELADTQCTMFCASSSQIGGRYQIDYSIPSTSWESGDTTGLLLPQSSHVTDCAAIGFTSRGTEKWPTIPPVHIECVGIPPYPGSSVPRVVGMALPPDHHRAGEKLLNYVTGDASRPRGGKIILAHVVNDATANWGGRGFAMALKRRWPAVQDQFAEWAGHNGNLALGSVHFADADERITVATIVAQKGYGDSKRPRIRYGALRSGFLEIATLATRTGRSIHMPRLGTGQAGGAWEVVVDMIKETICSKRIPVVVYSLPNSKPATSPQQHLSLFSEG